MHRPANARAKDNSEDAPNRREKDGLQQELPENFGPPGAKRLAYANLARTLRHTDGHDAHHTDATDEKCDRRQHDEREERGLADLIPQREKGVLRDDVEIVGLFDAEPVPN